MSVARSVAALTLGAIALIAVTYLSEDNSSMIHEDSTKVVINSHSMELPEDMESFVAVAMSKAKKSKFDPFHVYKWTKDEAAKKAPKAAFNAATKQCRLIRTGSYKKCANFYCAAKKACGDTGACAKKFGAPHKQVVPLTEGSGRHFYNVHEVDVKETHNKEVRAKEVGAKESASKERSVKEKGYKAKVAAEKSAKQAAKRERVTKEKKFKEKQAKERVTKEGNEKKKEASYKAQVLLQCIGKADKVQVGCQKKVAEKAEAKAQAAEAATKAAKTTAEKQKKKEAADAASYASAEAAYASQYASSGSGASGYTSGSTPPPTPNYASMLSVEQHVEAQDMAIVAQMEANSTSATGAADLAAAMAKAEATHYASEHTVVDGYKEKLVAYKSAVIAAGQNPIETQMPPPALDATEQAADTVAVNYANTVIPAGGQIKAPASGSGASVALLEDEEDDGDEAGGEDEDGYPTHRRLLSASDPIAMLMTGEGVGAGSGAPPTPPTAAPTAFDPKAAAAKVAALAKTIAADKAAQAADRLAAAKQVNATAAADQAMVNAENAFNTAHADNLDQGNRARLHASKAALAESKVSAVDSYVSTHRGALHETSCAEEKKFAFDVCFGRAAYKGQLFETKRAAESRNKADKYKKLMGKDYAVVIETNATLVKEEAKEKATNAVVVAAHKKFDQDSYAQALLKGEIRQEKATKAQQKAQEAKTKAEAQAAAALAKLNSPPPPSPVAVADNSTAPYASAAPATPANASEVALGSALLEDEEEEGDYEEENSEDDYEESELIQSDEPEWVVGRRLLSKPSKKACHKTSGQAFAQCKGIVNDAYSECTRLFQKAMGQ